MADEKEFQPELSTGQLEQGGGRVEVSPAWVGQPRDKTHGVLFSAFNAKDAHTPTRDVFYTIEEAEHLRDLLDAAIQTAREARG
jgi:hypothetical protein